ncbi:MAG: NADH-quinone oxidoreductase subunit L [Myxococcota bacterium]|nr:NADH-quinone oxidoreductase subunit L [Myxococcota bacterium]
MVETGADTVTRFEWLRWIPLLPLLGAALHGVMLGLLRREAPRSAVAIVSCGAPILAFVLTGAAFVQLVSLPGNGAILVDPVYAWLGAGRLSIDLAFHFDALAAVLALVVTGVGSLIHVYSVGYMSHDERDDGGFQRFFCYLNLFTCAMLLLVLGDNLLVMFLGWEGVGLCSYLLIGFWYGDRWNAYCGTKAFVLNRVGDFGFLVGMLLIVSALADVGAPSLAFRDVAAAIGELSARTVAVPGWLPGPETWRLTTLIGLCLFLGACGKSAQIPLQTWLPDAMAGPTPVSALIHAATMVTAGVYMVCRMGFLYAEAPGASAVIAWTGALTALWAATVAVAQTDIKKVLAYSTVSQLGYMFLAAGSGAYAAAMFHVFTHAFFKALLFLGAGAVILALHHEQDTDRMGGLWRRLPRTHAVFAIGVLAIAGFPGLSGFFSKDEILLATWLSHGPGHAALYAIGLVTAGITAFYMVRLHCRVFYGPARVPEATREEVTDPGPVILQPLYVLAALSVFGGLVGLPQVYGDWFEIPDSNSFANFLNRVVPHEPHAIEASTELWLGALTTAVALGGGGLAAWLYLRRPELPARIRGALGAGFRLVRDRYYVDEVYDALIVRPLVLVSDRVLFRVVDAGLIDGLAVNGTAATVRGLAARGLKHLHSGLTQGYLLGVVVGGAGVVLWLLRGIGGSP